MGRAARIISINWLVALVLLFFSALTPLGSAHAAAPLVCAGPPNLESLQELDAEALDRISCAPGTVDVGAERVAIRLNVEAGETPAFVISRVAKFSRLHAGVVTSRGVSWSQHDFASIKATFFDRQFAVELPSYEGQAQFVLIEVERPTQAATFEHMRLESSLPGASRGDLAALLIVALFAGVMLVPILFDLLFYRVLREPFMLWHAALALSLAIQLVCNFGLYAAYTDVSLPLVRVLSISSFSFLVLSAMMFSLRFIERGKVPDRLRKALIVCLSVHLTFAAVHMAGIEAFRQWPSTLFFSSGLPLTLLFIAVVAVALRNGSRSARYLAIGIAPLTAVALARVVSFLVPSIPTIDANNFMVLASLIEISATGFGVARRFVELKLERDQVRSKIDQLETVAERDPLTGLFNRRALDLHYDELRKDGFDTFALIDLDRFKDINDRFGHQRGDAVLESCARSLIEGDSAHCIAFRLGGEEFVLMLRGARPTQRADALRQAIPRRIAADVPELDRLVTASMGVLELPRRASDLMSFEEIYARADTLLYEAKASGRNRMLYERLSVFPVPRRRVDKAVT